MNIGIIPVTGVEGFVAALEAFDVGPTVEEGLVLYTIVPVSGAYASQPVRTGVLVDEAAPWPTTPPHWIHLSEKITFSATNMSGSPKVSWRSHSREIKAWGVASSPAAAWLAHVRGVLGGVL